MEAPELTEAQQICKEQRDLLRDLARVHVEIDTRRRQIGKDEPDWVLRLRKVALHVVPITKCEEDVDGLHAMASELRAAYRPLDAIWKCLPDEARLIDVEGDWREYDAGMPEGLAAFDHPTPARLVLPLKFGGLQDVEDPMGYLMMAGWLSILRFGYGRALLYLARFLPVEEDLRSRVEAEMLRQFEGDTRLADWMKRFGYSGM